MARKAVVRALRPDLVRGGSDKVEAEWPRFGGWHERELTQALRDGAGRDVRLPVVITQAIG
jgi:hypothetical protein